MLHAKHTHVEYATVNHAPGERAFYMSDEAREAAGNVHYSLIWNPSKDRLFLSWQIYRLDLFYHPVYNAIWRECWENYPSKWQWPISSFALKTECESKGNRQKPAPKLGSFQSVWYWKLKKKKSVKSLFYKSVYIGDKHKHLQYLWLVIELTQHWFIPIFDAVFLIKSKLQQCEVVYNVIKCFSTEEVWIMLKECVDILKWQWENNEGLLIGGWEPHRDPASRRPRGPTRREMLPIWMKICHWAT